MTATRSSDAARAVAAHVPLSGVDVDTTLTARFDATVERFGDCVAVSDDGRETSYTELGRRAGAIAAEITAAGARPGDPVTLLLDQGTEAVAAILGVLRAGGAFAPLDVLDPAPRAAHLVDLAGARVLVTTSARAGQASAVAAATRRLPAVVVLDERPANGDVTPAAPSTTPTSPASVFFTSGSTGTPKAVLDLHRNVLHNTLRYTNLLELRPSDRLSLIQRPSFSGIASSLFGALLNGATLCTFRLTAETLIGLPDWVGRERITVFHSVPAVFRSLVARGDAFPDVRVVRLEGDRASWSDAARFRRCFPADAVLANGLGTTETGLACQFRVTGDMPLGDGPLPVGSPAPDMEIVVLGETGDPVQTGVAGEIGVRSAYLAAGYVGAPASLAARFEECDGGRRLYRTGDLGRFEHGRLVHLGRLDGVAKIGGVRVEPAEVEAALLRVPGVAEATVTVEATRDGAGRLAARVVPDGPAPAADEIQHGLLELLPAFMVPARIDLVADLDVDANWKLTRASRRSPRTPLEREIRDIWAEALETEVGVDDTFVGLGGDSLTAAEVSATIERRLGFEVPYALLSRAPTVARLAAALETPGAPEGVTLTFLTDGAGLPLVLLPGHGGQAMTYSRLAGAMAPSHPVWSFEIATTADDLSVPGLARTCAASIRAALPDGPYVVGGFCYGAILALETARILRTDGRHVAPVLLGLEPQDVPTLVSAAALERWRRDVGERRLSLTRVRHHLRLARDEEGGDALRYLLTRAGKGFQHALRTAQGRRRPNSLQLGVGAFRPTALGGSATFVVGAGTAATYTDDPAAAWAGVADEVDVVVLPGISGDSVLLKDEVARLAAVFSELLVTVEAQSSLRTKP